MDMRAVSDSAHICLMGQTHEEIIICNFTISFGYIVICAGPCRYTECGNVA